MLTIVKNKIVRPLLDLLRSGATPERLAWSLAVGAAVGINPLLGSTTLLALALAAVLRLNVVASQLSNHLLYPLELLLFPVWIKLGVMLFRTEGLPLTKDALFDAVKHHPWDTTKLLWGWEWHALVVWAAAMCVAVPVMAWALRLALRRMLTSQSVAA
ncbi:DUF2062 domain-containing protein [Granulicella cerasi]|uniref:DUF2062 domain-containing protein n=1 Tax=Granulicella cerasi TaxID=741063 RepID=A0ABW1Z734_9BACT|nr:DUF2062 domain-containing protein [Granulicella cerasi]